MATNSRKVGLYIATGTLLAVVVIAAVFASGIQLPSSNQNQQNLSHFGTLAVYIKDAPVELSELNVTIDGLEVQNGTGWIALNFTEGTPSVTFNLLALQNVTKDLSIAQLPAGNYTKMRLHVEAANATFVGSDDIVPLKVPSGKIDIIVQFEVKENTTTQIIIDMTADTVAISNSNNLKPVIKATVIPPTSSTPGSDLDAAVPQETSSIAPSEIPEETPVESPTETPATSSLPA